MLCLGTLTFCTPEDAKDTHWTLENSKTQRQEASLAMFFPQSRNALHKNLGRQSKSVQLRHHLNRFRTAAEASSQRHFKNDPEDSTPTAHTKLTHKQKPTPEYQLTTWPLQNSGSVPSHWHLGEASLPPIPRPDFGKVAGRKNTSGHTNPAPQKPSPGDLILGTAMRYQTPEITMTTGCVVVLYALSKLQRTATTRYRGHGDARGCLVAITT